MDSRAEDGKSGLYVERIESHMKEVEELFSRARLVEDMNKRLGIGLREWEKQVIEKYFPPSGRILDIGCGCGREAIPLAKKGYDITAIDVSTPQLDRARENAEKASVTIAFEMTDGLQLPAGDFDVIVLWAQVLGNIEAKKDQLALLANCRKSLTERGLISASGHNKEFCRKDTPECTDEDWLYPWGKDELKYHLFTEKTFRDLFTQSGFQILDSQIPVSLPAIIHIVARKGSA